jgi:hypothetical protein
VPPVAQPEVTSSILRVLLEPREKDHNIWIATCLETGYVATGLGYAEARENILEILRNEVTYAAENGRKLTLQSPIPAVLEQKWEAVISERPPETIPLFSQQPSPTPDKKPPARVKQVAVARAIR